MGSFTNYLEVKLLDYVFGASSYTAPSYLYVGVATGDITEAGVITGEPTGGGYQRFEIENTLTNFPTVTGGHKHNASLITFPTASDLWGEINNFFIADASSDGNVLVYGALDAPRTINTSEQLIFAIDAITITLD